MAASVGSWLCAGKNSRASHSRVKEGLFRGGAHSVGSVVRLRRQERPQATRLSVFIEMGNFTG